MATVVVATGNPGKLAEMRGYLAELDWQLQLKPTDLDIAETGQTFAENARIKALSVAVAMRVWAIADDSGLAVKALNGAPGLYSARYGKSDRDRIARLLRELGATGSADRSAQFVCALALARPDGTIAAEAEGICRGEILTAPRGNGGFGYDPIFYVPEQGKTFAELTPDEKDRISHRGVAFARLMPQLKVCDPSDL
ncbi:MAG: RdgB/HAM1 family non-canonical purine NTP pyrophosphatase [Cyanobacteria bacterium P01_D01_bin.128]